MTSTSSAPLQITVNGAAHPLRAAFVSDLVAELLLDPRAVAIEQNRVIVPRSQYAVTRVNAGDAIEIVRFIGGG